MSPKTSDSISCQSKQADGVVAQDLPFVRLGQIGMFDAGPLHGRVVQRRIGSE